MDEFTREGDHVIPASMGGEWIDRSVSGSCNKRANETADILITKDFKGSSVSGWVGAPYHRMAPSRGATALTLSFAACALASVEASGALCQRA